MTTTTIKSAIDHNEQWLKLWANMNKFLHELCKRHPIAKSVVTEILDTCDPLGSFKKRHQVAFRELVLAAPKIKHEITETAHALQTIAQGKNQPHADSMLPLFNTHTDTATQSRTALTNDPATTNITSLIDKKETLLPDITKSRNKIPQSS